jgi:hypothetical protein
LKDDIFKKLQNLLSGSIKLSEELDPYDDQNILDNQKEKADLVNSFMNQILDSAWAEEELKSSIAPSYYLSKDKKSYWLMNTSLKILVNIKGGIEIIPIELGQKKSLCMIGHAIFSIPNDLMICAGWN